MRFIVEVYWEQVDLNTPWERPLGSWKRLRRCRVRQGDALQSQINASMVLKLEEEEEERGQCQHDSAPSS